MQNTPPPPFLASRDNHTFVQGSRGDSAGVLNNKAGVAYYTTAGGAAFSTARGVNAGASNVIARGDDTARGDKAREDKARGLNNTPGASNNTAGGAYYSKARGAVAGASNVAARGDDTARDDTAGGDTAGGDTAGGDTAGGDTAGGDTVRGASIGGATSNITGGGDITAGSDSVAPGAYNTSQGAYYTDISGGASPLSLPPLPIMTVEMTPTGADEAACPARGTNEAAFPARGTDEAACPARSAHKASNLASGASDNEIFPSISPLTVAQGHGDNSLIDSDSVSLTIEYSFVRGEADDDSVSNTPTARGLYGQYFASEEVI
jgi:hypothetical protein